MKYLEQSDYWRSADSVYLRKVFDLAYEVATDATSVIDVGTNGCPYLEGFGWIPRRTSLDLITPYRSETVKGIKADFLKWSSSEQFDLCLCLQVLEHIPDAASFAQKLLTTAPRVIVSVPYLWPADSCEGHVHDPVDETKIESWFGRAPDRQLIVTEPNSGRHARRLICYFKPAPVRVALRRENVGEADLIQTDLSIGPESSVATIAAGPAYATTDIVKKPKVTVIVTHHNYSAFIASAIDSVLNQTYDNVDCIIVDDRSDRQHQQSLRQLYEARRCDRLRLIFNENNLGQISSFFVGVDNTDADFVCLLDPDDRYLPEFIDEMVSAHLNPYGVVPMICCDQVYGSSERQITGISLSSAFPGELYKGIEANRRPEYTLKVHGTSSADWPWTSTSSMMFRQAAVRLMRPKAELRYKKAADAYLARGAQFLGGTIVYNKPLTVRTVHQNNSWLTDAVLSASQRKFAVGALQMEPLCREDVLINIIDNDGCNFFHDEHFHGILLRCFNAEQRAAMAKRSPFVADFCSCAYQNKIAYQYCASASREMRRHRGWLVAFSRVLSHLVTRVPISIVKLAIAPLILPFSKDYFHDRVVRCRRRLMGAAGAVAGLFGSARS
jgi:glycosyltransferase involved in cell wall biosynthesis